MQTENLKDVLDDGLIIPNVLRELSADIRHRCTVQWLNKTNGMRVC